MMGAILHTVNIRLSPDQILYTMNHAEDDVVLVHEDFLPILEGIAGQLTTVKKYMLLKEGAEKPATSLPIAAEYEEMLAQASDSFNFPEFDEDTQAQPFTRPVQPAIPKGSTTATANWCCTPWEPRSPSRVYTAPGRFQSADVYMPITPMFHVHAWGFPFVATMLGAKHVYPGRYEPAMLLKLFTTEKVTFSHCVPTILHMILSSPAAKDVDLQGLEGSHRRIRASQRVGKDRDGARNRHLYGLRHVRDLSCSDPGQSQAGHDGLGGWSVNLTSELRPACRFLWST